MKKVIVAYLIVFIFSSLLYSDTTIPGQAWSRDINGAGYKDGAPIGGFGAGMVTWRLNGNFYKTRLDISAGSDDGTSFVDDTNAKFFLYQKPASGSASVKQLDAATLGSGQATYYSLFPKSWVDYYGSQFTVKSKVTQFSPIIPGDYQRTSYPVGIYEWELSNPTSENVDAAIMLTWQNNYSGASAAAVTSGNYQGIVLKSGITNPANKNQGEFCLGTMGGTGVTVSYLSAATLAAITTDFSADGVLSNTVGNNTIGGIAFKVTLAPGQSVKIPIVLSWDIPIAQPSTGDKWYREYTRYWTRTGTNSWAIAQDALANYASYESQIDTWQNGILTNPYYPEWLKTMLFNELYIYFDGGTMWEAGAASGQQDNTSEDMFSHLESYIYEFYGTSDVRFYGSWALFLNWPDIDKQALRQFSDSIYTTRTDRPAALGTCAHDFGDPTNVFEHWNAYIYRDSTTWKDLNSKFVLMVYRDYLLTGSTDTTFLTYCWNSVKTAMNKVHSQCAADGLPQSAGIDQTYDDMGLTGTTAYCGSLFLAACQAAKQIAYAMGDTATGDTYQSWFNTAQPNFESELWTGSYYKIDTGSTAPTRIMSDQLCGQWYSKALGLGGIVSDAHAQSAWQKVYDNNFSLFDSGTHGICNVFTAGGAIDTSTSQTQECWVGTSWGAVSGMVQEGMVAQGSAVGQSLYNTIWNTGQYWFRTPEAWTKGLAAPRAFYYMRGTTVWAAKRAYDLYPLVCGAQTCTPPPTNTPTNTPTPTATYNACAASYYRINCGNVTFTAKDSLNRNWAPDQAYTTGGYGYVAGTGTEANVGNAIANTTDDVLYQSGRYGGGLEYRFTVPNGPWRVVLKFAEIYTFTVPGQRVFNVSIEGTPVLTNFDIISAGGSAFTAVDRTFDVTVSDGVLNILFTTGTADVPKINAIEILDASVVCSPTTTPTYAGTPTKTPTFTPTRTNTPYYSPTFTRTNTPYYSATTTPTLTISPTYTSTPVFSDLRVNCAGPQYISTPTGFTWLADQPYGSGNTWGYTVQGTENTVADAIAGTADDTLFDTERWNSTLGYAFDIPNGQYQVTLRFAELWYGIAGRGGTTTGANSRKFNVAIEGTQVLTNFDVFATAGAADTAVDQVFTVNLSDGTLNIDLTQGTADNPTIEAIQIVRLFPTPTNTPTYTKTRTVTPTSTPQSPTFTPSRTGTQTCTPTQSNTPTASQTGTQPDTETYTPTVTVTDTPTQTVTQTATRTATLSSTMTATQSSTPTFTGTMTATPTMTMSPTATVTLSFTITQTHTVSPTITPTVTGTPPTATDSPTITTTMTPTPSYTPTSTPTFSATQTATPADTATNTPVNTASNTQTPNASGTNTPAATSTMTGIPPSVTVTATFTPTFTPTYTRTPSNTATCIITPTFTPSIPAGPTLTFTPTESVVFPTATATPYNDAANIAVSIENIYPCPYSPNSGALNIGFKLTKAVRFYKVKIYSVSFRLIKELYFSGTGSGGEYTAPIPADVIRTMANGAYYAVVEAETSDSRDALSKPGILVIIK
jgi:non-lysosomal glucosylceramidase